MYPNLDRTTIASKRVGETGETGERDHPTPRGETHGGGTGATASAPPLARLYPSVGMSPALVPPPVPTPARVSYPSTPSVAPSAPALESRARAAAAADAPKPTRPPSLADGTEFIKVPVSSDDSVASVAFRYNMTESELRQYNRQLIFDFCTVDYVFVPFRPGADPAGLPRNRASELVFKRYLARKAVVAAVGARLSDCEIDFYLDQSDWDAGRALAQIRSDETWEASHRAAAAAEATAAAAEFERDAATATASVTLENAPLLVPSAPPAETEMVYRGTLASSSSSSRFSDM